MQKSRRFYGEDGGRRCDSGLPADHFNDCWNRQGEMIGDC